jgi:Tol biopolymer transport system component
LCAATPAHDGRQTRDATRDIDGRFVAFDSFASDLVAGDSDGTRDVFVRDRLTGTTERVSLSSGGAQDDAFNDGSSVPAISADGRYVAFVSAATNFVTGDSNGAADVFLRDRATDIAERVSIGGGNEEANGNASSNRPAVSADGNLVVFGSTASNLVPFDTNGVLDIFVRGRAAHTTVRISSDAPGVQGNGSDTPVITPDGRVVAFGSPASLVADDTNGIEDVFAVALTAPPTPAAIPAIDSPFSLPGLVLTAALAALLIRRGAAGPYWLRNAT